MTEFLRHPPKTLFDEIARLLFGDLFFAEMLAYELNVSQRIVERWASGARGVPPFVWPILTRLLAEKGAVLYEQAIELETRIGREDFPQRDPLTDTMGNR